MELAGASYFDRRARIKLAAWTQGLFHWSRASHYLVPFGKAVSFTANGRTAVCSARAALCAKRGKRRWGPCVKAPKQLRRHSQMRGSAKGRNGVRRTRQKAARVLWAPIQASPRTLAKFDPRGQILARRSLFSLDRARPVKVSREAARGPSGGFLFSLARERKEKWGVHRPAPVGATPPSRARGATPPSRARGATPSSPPAAGNPRPAPGGKSPSRPRREIPVPRPRRAPSSRGRTPAKEKHSRETGRPGGRPLQGVPPEAPEVVGRIGLTRGQVPRRSARSCRQKPAPPRTTRSRSGQRVRLPAAGRRSGPPAPGQARSAGRGAWGLASKQQNTLGGSHRCG